MKPLPEMKPRAYGAQADLRAPRPASGGPSVAAVVKNLVAFVVSVLIWKEAHVVEVMWYSSRVLRGVLNVALLCHAVLFLVGLYLTWIVGAADPNWSKDEQYNKHIHVATIAMLIGSLLWTVAMWPVFHMWTIPLGVLGAVAGVTFLTLISLIPGVGKKKARRVVPG
jgi:archaellum biogenesis protein FlaJ (TadC family)